MGIAPMHALSVHSYSSEDPKKLERLILVGRGRVEYSSNVNEPSHIIAAQYS